MTIKRKLLCSILLTFVVIGLVGWLTGIGIRNSQLAQISRSMDALSSVEVARITDRLANMATSISVAADRERLGDLIVETDGTPPAERRGELDPALGNLVRAHPMFKAGTLLDLNGVPISDTSAADIAWKPAMATTEDFSGPLALVERGAPYAAGAAFRLTPSDERFVHLIPLSSNGEVVGYLAGECDFASIADLLGQYTALGESSEAHLVQRIETGAQVITDLRFKADSRFDTVIPVSKDRAPAVLALLGSAGTYHDLTDYRDQTVIASVRHVPGSPWSLVVKVDNSEAFGQMARALYIGLIGFSTGGLLALGLFGTAFGSLLRRIRRVSDSAQAITSGDLSSRVGDLSGDELGVLARSFDQMADTLVADMARRREVEAELAHSAGHDLLTGLPNRLTFQNELKQALLNVRSGVSAGSVAVFFCDLDEFKTVNDDLGHSAGDALLRDVAQRFGAAVGPQHVLARFGGDEFVVVARGLTSDEEAFELAERMRESLSTPVSLAGRDVFVTTSVGVAISRSGATAETLVRDADAAMYRAKEVGRHRVVLYNETIGARANNRLNMTTELRRAIAHGGLTTAAQPIVDLNTGDIYAYEVLVRWSHGGREIDPSEFVMRATELDLAGALDRWVLDEACRSMRRLQGTTIAEAGWLHVNATGTSLIDVGFADDVLRILATNHLPPSALCLEIVEDRLGGASHDTLETLARLRRHGVRVAIDDFGTGHSSLARLRDLPADTVKIDQSFVRDIATDRASVAITSSIISLARELGLEVIAEGIEQLAQQEVLQRIGCRYGQGYLLCPPQAVAEVVNAALVG